MFMESHFNSTLKVSPTLEYTIVRGRAERTRNNSSQHRTGYKAEWQIAGYFTLFGSRGGGGGHFEVKEGHPDFLQKT